MSRHTIILRGSAARASVVEYAFAAPDGTRVDFKAAKRSLPQNDLMWSLLTSIARKLPWHGEKLTPNDWKLLFLDALQREVRIVPNLDGTGRVNLRRSSDLSKDEMSQLIELIRDFGARHGVKFIDERAAA
jgi:hypothetical protein